MREHFFGEGYGSDCGARYPSPKFSLAVLAKIVDPPSRGG